MFCCTQLYLMWRSWCDNQPIAGLLLNHRGRHNINELRGCNSYINGISLVVQVRWHNLHLCYKSNSWSVMLLCLPIATRKEAMGGLALHSRTCQAHNPRESQDWTSTSIPPNPHHHIEPWDVEPLRPYSISTSFVSLLGRYSGYSFPIEVFLMYDIGWYTTLHDFQELGW